MTPGGASNTAPDGWVSDQPPTRRQLLATRWTERSCSTTSRSVPKTSQITRKKKSEEVKLCHIEIEKRRKKNQVISWNGGRGSQQFAGVFPLFERRREREGQRPKCGRRGRVERPSAEGRPVAGRLLAARRPAAQPAPDPPHPTVFPLGSSSARQTFTAWRHRTRKLTFSLKLKMMGRKKKTKVNLRKYILYLNPIRNNSKSRQFSI